MTAKQVREKLIAVAPGLIETADLLARGELKDYHGDKQVLLDVHVVRDFTGEAEGREGQPLRWVTVAELHQFEFPAANVPIVEAVQKLLCN